MNKLLIVMLLASLLCIASCAQVSTDIWKDHLISYGDTYCQSGDNYYDAARVYYQLADLTGNSKWESCAEKALRSYVDGYLIPNDFKAAGHMIFPHGLLQHYQRTGDQKSKNALLGLAQKASFSYAPLEWTAPSTVSREVAYNLEAKILAEKVGYHDDKRMEELANQALGHYEQWFETGTAPYVRPFMAALTAEALILWYDKTQDPRVLSALRVGADWLWEHMWNPRQQAFQYTDRVMEHGGMEPASDLNLLIAPLYGWLYKMTGEEKYRQQGDQIFEGGVWSSYLSQPKHFNQNYRWSFQYLTWRESHAK